MKKKILIIEDDISIREVLSWFLEEEGFEVIGTTMLSVSSLVKNKVDLILLDEWISKTEGHRLCEQIKQIHQFQHTPVIILSTSPLIEEIAEGCKADGFIRMPFDLEEVISKVEKCFFPDRKTSAVLN